MGLWVFLYFGLLLFFSIGSLYYLTLLPYKSPEGRQKWPIASSFSEKPLQWAEVSNTLNPKDIPPGTTLLNSQQYDHYMSLCEGHHLSPKVAPPNFSRINQRASSHREILIQNATVIDGLGNVLENYDVQLKNGLIHRLGKGLVVPENSSIKILNVNGKYLTPGIVDMHSHVGLAAAPFLLANDETNEENNPIHPELRAIDGFNIYDNALPQILAGGVTSTLVIPGSANLIGGEGYVIKTPKPKSNKVEDMLIQANLTAQNAFKTGGGFRRWIKMACGENPKRTYGIDKKMSPYTRLSSAQHMREAFQEASKVKAKQDEWCAIALRLNPVKLSKPQSSSSCAHLLKHHKEEDPNLQYFLHPNGHYPSSPKWDTLVALLRHQVGLHWHCYLSYDAETQLRIASEFNVSVKAFHHALDLHQTIPLLKQHQVGVAIFSDHWGYKAEAYTASVHAAKKFLKAGVPMAFKSDHPVQNARYLTYESSKSIQYGLKPQAWIQSITSVPATLLDLNHRIGKIQPGMDADIVLWNASPMAIGARPTRVYVDGNLAFHEKLESFEPTPPLFKTWALFPSIKKKYVLFKNAQIVYQNELKRNLQVLINPQGLLMCIREECPLDQGNTVVYDLKHAVITAPLVSAGTELGFTEISQEPITNEGKIVIDDMFIRASEGFLAGGKLEYAAVNQGVLHTISAPPVKCSASTLYLSSSGLFVLNKTVPTALQEPVAFHVPEHVGSHASFVSLLVKKVIMLNESSIPLVLKTDHASHMAVLLSLKKNIAPHMIWIFHGAGEAELILDLLEEAENVILLLTTSRCAPYNWSDRRCTLQLIPSLKKRKIPFILSTSPYSVSDARNLRFEAGWARRLANLSFVEMVNLVTVDVMKAFNLTKYTDPFKIGVEARFLIWNGDFGEIDTQLMYVIDGSTKDIVHVPKHL